MNETFKDQFLLDSLSPATLQVEELRVVCGSKDAADQLASIGGLSEMQIASPPTARLTAYKLHVNEILQVICIHISLRSTTHGMT